MKDSKTSPCKAWFIWSLCACFYFYEFLLQVSPSVMATDLMASFDGMTASTLGLLGSIYFWVYALIQIPVGLLVDKIGPRKLLSAAALMCSLSCYLFSHTHVLWAAFISRGMIGLGSAFAIIGCMKIITNWFKPNMFALVIGLTVTIGALGAISGESALAYYVQDFGWRTSMEHLGIIGIVLSILIGYFVRDYPEGHSHTQDNGTQELALMNGLKRVVNKKQNWLTALYAGLMYAPTLAFAALWGGPYLMQAFHLTRTDAGNIISFIFIGWAIGSPVIGYLSDKMQLRKPLMLASALLALILMSILIYMPGLSVGQLKAVAFCYGLLYSGFLLAFSVVKEINPLIISGTALGFMNTVNSLGGAILQPIIGHLLDKVWDGTLHNGTPHYSLQNYHFALMSLVGVLLLAVICIPFIKETHCKQIDSK